MLFHFGFNDDEALSFRNKIDFTDMYRMIRIDPAKYYLHVNMCVDTFGLLQLGNVEVYLQGTVDVRKFALQTVAKSYAREYFYNIQGDSVSQTEFPVIDRPEGFCTLYAISPWSRDIDAETLTIVDVMRARSSYRSLMVGICKRAETLSQGDASDKQHVVVISAPIYKRSCPSTHVDTRSMLMAMKLGMIEGYLLAQPEKKGELQYDFDKSTLNPMNSEYCDIINKIMFRDTRMNILLLSAFETLFLKDHQFKLEE